MKKNVYYFCMLLLIILVVSITGAADCRAYSWEGTYVNFIEGDAYGSSQGRAVSRFEKNIPLDAGDEIHTGDTCFVEIILSDGGVIWLNADTVAGLDAYSSSLPTVDLSQGDLFLRTPETSETDSSFLVKTSGSTVSIYPGSFVKISLHADSGLDVEVWEGGADAQFTNGSVSLKKGKLLSVQPDGSSFSSTTFVQLADDGFESMTLKRNEKIKNHAYVEYLQEPLNGVSSLTDYGDWNYDTRITSYVWRPYVNTSWRPYLRGRWINHCQGPYWLSYDPWGSTPYHYGRWTTDSMGRWCWVPGVSSGYSMNLTPTLIKLAAPGSAKDLMII